ncbi:hypothetical protein CEXT_583821 [Caerostris extrusa]|uniref:Uncharacterized protein n=1 Tax=Caerostris extrusa TaxID=172846 RepID=A0AAV4VWB4_CAEEX|nr:hypothetical protein CEXT_583821 [Caerostris extrusa]
MHPLKRPSHSWYFTGGKTQISDRTGSPRVSMNCFACDDGVDQDRRTPTSTQTALHRFPAVINLRDCSARQSVKRERAQQADEGRCQERERLHHLRSATSISGY